jgi:hypothetical protein
MPVSNQAPLSVVWKWLTNVKSVRVQLPPPKTASRNCPEPVQPVFFAPQLGVMSGVADEVTVASYTWRIVPLTPAATVLPLSLPLCSHAPGLCPALVTNVPFLYSTCRLYVVLVSLVSVNALLKLSSAQVWLQVPVSSTPLTATVILIVCAGPPLAAGSTIAQSATTDATAIRMVLILATFSFPSISGKLGASSPLHSGRVRKVREEPRNRASLAGVQRSA